MLLNEECDVFITSYDLLKRDIGKYKNHSFACEVLDEGQFIKNPKAAVSKSVKIVNADHRFVLTGTPIENRLSELWSIFDFLMPGFLYTYDRFRQDFETPISKNKDELVTSRLRKMVSPFILRRIKKDVLKDLPDKMEEVRYARFDDDQQKVYDGQVVRMKQLIATAGNDGQAKIRILAELTRIRQICCDPSLILENYEGGSAKKDACMTLIESAIDGGHKMLVFSQFTSMIEILKKELDERKIQYYVITGATSKEERMRLVHKFNDNDVPVFLISLKAGGTGLKLTGADVVIHYDPWWNLAAQNQATDRAHRIGQKSTVTVYRIIAKDTIEEKILELQEAKKDLSDAILSGESTSLAQLSGEELMELLS
jgi:SNF2 family DNA or RNA helicase